MEKRDTLKQYLEIKALIIVIRNIQTLTGFEKTKQLQTKIQVT